MERNPYLTESEQREMAEIEQLLMAAERWAGGGGERRSTEAMERERRSERSLN